MISSIGDESNASSSEGSSVNPLHVQGEENGNKIIATANQESDGSKSEDVGWFARFYESALPSYHSRPFQVITRAFLIAWIYAIIPVNNYWIYTLVKSQLWVIIVSATEIEIFSNNLPDTPDSIYIIAYFGIFIAPIQLYKWRCRPPKLRFAQYCSFDEPYSAEFFRFLDNQTDFYCSPPLHLITNLELGTMVVRGVRRAQV